METTATLLTTPPETTPPGSNGTTPPPGPGAGLTPGSGPGLAFSDSTLAQSQSLQRYKSTDDLGKAYLELERKIGTRPLDIPGEQADDAAWQTFWKQIPGYPERDDQYAATVPQLPEGMGIDPELMQSFKKGAHARGLTNKQLEYVMGFYGEHLVTKPFMDSQRKLQEQGQMTLKRLSDRYGSMGAQSVLATAREYIRRTYGDDSDFLDAVISKNGSAMALGNTAEIIEAFYELGMSRGYNQYVQGDGGGGLLSPAQAEQQLQTAAQQLQRKEISPQEYNAKVQQLQPLITAARQQGQQAGNRM